MHAYHNIHNVYCFHYMSTSTYIYIYTHLGMHAYISQPNLDTNSTHLKAKLVVIDEFLFTKPKPLVVASGTRSNRSPLV